MLSIVIPTYNNLFFTQQIIGLIEQTTKFPHNLIIVDNGSSEDGMQEYFDFINNRYVGGEIIIIRNGGNLGVAKAWNIGIKKAVHLLSEYIAVLNNDILIDNDCFERLIKIMEERENLLCLSPAFTRLQMPDNWHELAYKQRQKEPVLYTGGKGFFFIFKNNAISILEKPKQGFFIDEQFDMLWYEDTDLFERFKKAGYPAMSVDNVLIHHFESKTIKLIPNAGKYKTDNRQKYFEKYDIKKD